MDLVIRVNVSEGCCSNIFLSWLGATAEQFKAFVFIHNLETVLATTSDRFRCSKNLIVIIDCTEVIIETTSLESQHGVQHGLNINIIIQLNFLFVLQQIHVLYMFQRVIQTVYLTKLLRKNLGF